MNPTVSIIIPTYESKYLSLLLDSIYFQSYQNIEVIISDDSVSNIVENGYKNHKVNDKYSVKYFRNLPAMGSPANWNLGIRRSIGEIVKLMHHDDWFISENAIQQYVDIITQSKHPTLIFSKYILKDLTSKREHKRECTVKEFAKFTNHPDYLFKNNFLGTPSVICFSKDLNLFFDENLIWQVDVEFYIRAAKQMNNVFYLEDYLVGITIEDPDQITNSVVKSNPTLKVKELVYVAELKTLLYLSRHLAKENLRSYFKGHSNVPKMDVIFVYLAFAYFAVGKKLMNLRNMSET